MPTRDDCKRMISKTAFKCGVSPRLIATRLLSEDDKQDMLNGDLSLEALEAHVNVWKEVGLPDYAHGNCERYKPER